MLIAMALSFEVALVVLALDMTERKARSKKAKIAIAIMTSTRLVPLCPGRMSMVFSLLSRTPL
jgi:hypothetical protein